MFTSEAHTVAHKRTRRGPGEGSIYRRGDGYYVGQVEAGHYPNGKRRRARVVRRRRADVVAALDELRRDSAGGVVPDRTHTVSTFLGWWLDEVAAGQVAASSLVEYRKRVRRVTPAIGAVRLAKLSPAHVQSLANDLGRRYPRSPKTRADALATLRQALRWATQAGMLLRNPADGVQGPRMPIATIDDTLTDDEAHRVLAVAQRDAPDLYALVWLALGYGLRLGELLDLRWSDVDLPGAELHVRRSKTQAGVRSLPLIDEAVDVLRGHRARDTVAALDGRVFVTRAGGRQSEQNVRRAWSRLLDAAGVAHRCRNCGSDDACSASTRRFHASRHTAATLLLQRGVALEVVSSILGHASLGITSDTYAKVRNDLKRAALNGTSTSGTVRG